MTKRRKFEQEFKAKVALAALKGNKTTAELSSMYEVHGNMINRWVKEAQERLSEIFATDNGKDQNQEQLIEKLYQRIGQLNVENEWLKKNRIFKPGRKMFFDRAWE